MFQSVKRFIIKCATVTTLGVAASVPAQAGGSFSLDIVPGTYEDAQLIRSALTIYQIAKAIDNPNSIRQNGHNNRAGLRQNGVNNRGIIYQEGNGHNGSINQIGNNNAWGLFQFGKRTNAQIRQRGQGGTGATLVFGW